MAFIVSIIAFEYLRHNAKEGFKSKEFSVSFKITLHFF